MRIKERKMDHAFKGIFAPLTTPFVGDEISIEKLKENIQKYNRFDLAGYVILGSTGESVLLSDEESEKLVRAAREAASPGKKIIVGTARESTKLTLDFTNRVAAYKIDAALVRTPSYFKARMNQEALKKHYLTLAEKSKVPIIIYNIPQNTGITIDNDLVVDLSSHPNIAGIKDSSGNLAALGEVIPHLDPQFSSIIGSAFVLFAGLELGASGAIITLADAAPALCVKLFKLFLEGKRDEARELQFDLIPLNKAIIVTYGIPGLKYGLDLQGYYGGPCRLPLLPLDEKGKKEMEAILKKLGLLKK